MSVKKMIRIKCDGNGVSFNCHKVAYIPCNRFVKTFSEAREELALDGWKTRGELDYCPPCDQAFSAKLQVVREKLAASRQDKENAKKAFCVFCGKGFGTTAERDEHEEKLGAHS